MSLPLDRESELVSESKDRIRQRILPGGDIVKIMMSDLLLHSAANEWRELLIFYYTSLAPQFCFK